MIRKQAQTIFFFLAPTITLVLAFLYLPIITNFINSLYSWSAFSPKWLFVGLANYARMFQDNIFYLALRNNLIFVAISIIFQIGVSLILAFILENTFMRKYQAFFRTVYFIPSLLMVTVTGLAFQMIYSPTIGLVSPLLELCGVNTENIDLLGHATSAIYAVVAVSQWQYIGYTLILFVVAMQNIPKELYEAADIDGARIFVKFIKITIPQIKSMIMVNMIITITGAFRVFDEVYVMTSGGPGRSTETLATYIYRSGFRNDEMGYASALAFFVFIVTFSLSIFQINGYQDRIKQGMGGE